MINDSVLVLNRNWIAVHICNVRRAFSLLYQGLARAVSDDFMVHDFESWADLSVAAGSRVIYTPSLKMMIPDVIILRHFSKLPPRYVKFSRRNIYLRDKNVCQYCGDKFNREDLTIDHVIPRSLGGKSTWKNVVLACVRCNSKKGDKSPAECGMQLVQKPKKPHWVTCFRISGETNKSLWQKFVDDAYWNVTLYE